jgi:archaeosortase A (PGF-CTERM-specific)
MDVILVAGLFGLGAGYYLKDQRCHKFRLIGFVLFGIFWILQVPHFTSTGDAFNAIVCILALPFYAFLGYNEYLSYSWNEENSSLKWIAGASFFAGGIYFLIDKIPILSGYIIYGTAVQTVGLVNTLGFDYDVGAINYAGNPLLYRTNFNEIFVPISGSSVAIIQSCTAIQSMLIFIGAIYCVQADSRQKWRAFFATVPLIYVLNLARNVGIIYMMDELEWSYDFSHNTVGKLGSFLALIILAVIAFKVLPQLLDNIIDLMDLAERKRKDQIEEGGKEEDSEQGLSEDFQDQIHKEDEKQAEDANKESNQGD